MGSETASALSALKNPHLDPDNLLRILCILPQTGDGAIEGACVILSLCAPWTPDKIGVVQSRIAPPSHPAFQFGLSGQARDPKLISCIAPPDVGIVTAGHCLGTARRIQAVKNGAPLSFLCPDMGWELE
jgi:hypothetical protein